MDIDDGDEIVKEIDVVLSQDLIDQLYVMQYPLRPLWRGYDNSQLEAMRFKQGQQVLEMEYRLKDEEKSKEQQTRISSATTGQEFDDPTRSMQTYTVRSSVVPNKSNYLVGLYRGDELHVTPLKGVMQMRPSFAYIDQSAEAKRKKSGDGESMAADRSAASIRASMDDMAEASKMDLDQGGGGGGVELKPVQFQVKKKETERAVQNRLRSYAYLKQLEMEEEFQKLDFVHRDRMDAMAVFERIAGRNRSPIPVPPMKSDQFLMAINPPLGEDGSPLSAEQIAADQKEPRTNYAKAELADFKSRRVIPNQVPPTLSLHTIRQLAPSDQIQALFNNTNVLTWAQVQEYSNIESKTELLKLVQIHAILVHGVWVVKTEKSYKHRAANIRNWIMARMATTSPNDPETWYTSRQFVASSCDVSTELAGSILDPITELVPGSGLKLKYAPDDSFYMEHTEVCHKYDVFWQKSIAQIEVDMRRWIKDVPATTTATNATATSATAQRKSTTKTTQAALVATNAKSAAEAAAAAAAAASSSNSSALIVETGAITTNLDLDSIANVDAVPLSATAELQIKTFINDAIQTYGVISPKGLTMLAKRRPTSVSEVDTFTEQLATQELAKHTTKLREVYVTNPPIEKDSWRDVLLDLFRASASFSRQEVGAAFWKHLQKDPPRTVYTRLISELVIVKDGIWHLKSGDASEGEKKIL
jgi:DNA-directed RNA polymerase-3 subunit RPC5